MNGFNLEKNVQFLEQDYENLTYIQEKLDDLVYDEEYIDVMFTHDFNFSITEQYFNPDLFLLTGDYVDNVKQGQRLGCQNLEEWKIYNITIRGLLMISIFPKRIREDKSLSSATKTNKNNR